MLTLEIDAPEIDRWLAWAAEREPQVKKIKAIQMLDGKLHLVLDLGRWIPDVNLRLAPKLTGAGTIELVPDVERVPKFITDMLLRVAADKIARFGIVKTATAWEFSYARLRENLPQLPDLTIAALQIAASKLRLAVTLK